MANPKTNNIKPMANLTGPEGLNLLSQILEKRGAKAIIKKEFKIPNQEAGTSATSAVNSRRSIQKIIPQTITKLVPKKTLDSGNRLNVRLKRLISTKVKIIIGATTRIELDH